MGGQPLYSLDLAVNDYPTEPASMRNLPESRRHALRIGMRTLTVEQRPDPWGRSFALCANGVEFFAMGADYIPEDNLITRPTPAQTARLLRDCVAAHHNCIRVWGGGYYPDDHFYDLCDELGLVIWQDLLFACALYDFNPAFQETIRVETVQNIRRLRHHAALGLWCGNNEMEQAIVEWNLKETPRQRAEYIKIYEVFLPELASREDPDRFYWLASPSSFGSFDQPNSQDYGDMHDWSIWHGKAPFTDYRKRFPRFMSEFGLQSYPTAKTLAPCIPPGQRNPFSYLMELREKHSAGVFPLLHYLQQYFRMPSGFENQLYISHLMQAEGVRYGVEHWRRNRGRCMGAIIWQLNDCWPGISWSSIDYAGRWKALHYASKRFFNPVLASAAESGSHVELHVTNDTLRECAGHLVWKFRGRGDSILREGSTSVQIGALSSRQDPGAGLQSEIVGDCTAFPFQPWHSSDATSARKAVSATSNTRWQTSRARSSVRESACWFLPSFSSCSRPRIEWSLEGTNDHPVFADQLSGNWPASWKSTLRTSTPSSRTTTSIWFLENPAESPSASSAVALPPIPTPSPEPSGSEPSTTPGSTMRTDG
jgi:beta-mannosidase